MKPKKAQKAILNSIDLMKYFSGLLTILFILAGCSPSEPLVEEEIEEPETEISAAPDWYDDRVHSTIDSLAFHGYSMASASDSARAAELAEQSAIENLKFEIDRHSDQVRSSLAEENDGYGNPEFIISLRNAVQSLNLSGAEITHAHEESEAGVHYIYLRATLTRDEVQQNLSEFITDQSFLNQFNSDL